MIDNVLALDVGGRRIGMAVGDTTVKIPRILPTVEVSEHVFEQIARIVKDEKIKTVVIGYPRNLSGETTAQTGVIEDFKTSLESHIDTVVVYQDESLTSVKAEDNLRMRGRPYDKGDIDAEAAALILTDYLES